jgi:hypothetical protein
MRVDVFLMRSGHDGHGSSDRGDGRKALERLVKE